MIRGIGSRPVEPFILGMEKGKVYEADFAEKGEVPAFTLPDIDPNPKSSNVTIAPDPTPQGNPQATAIDLFTGAMEKATSAVNTRQNEAALSTEQFAGGQKHRIHETMIELEQAEISLRFLGSVRNRMLEAYQEIMRINI